MFDSVNDGIQGLQFLEAASADDLLRQLQSITLPVKIEAIYAQGFKHFAWIRTTAKIVKKTKKAAPDGNQL